MISEIMVVKEADVNLEGTPVDGAMDNQMIALMRLMLASLALIIVLINPLESNRLSYFIYEALAAYVVYSALLYAALKRNLHRHWVWPFVVWQHWIDIACYTLLIALSNGTNSLLFLFYFFALIVASFQGGFIPGLSAAIVSVLLFSLVGILTVATTPDFNITRFLLRAVYLSILGYTISSLGGSEVVMKRRLFLLKDMSLLPNPRFGIERTLGLLTERLRNYYDAEKCVMVMGEWNQMESHLRRAVRSRPEAAMMTLPLTLPMHHQLLTLPGEATLWQRRHATKGEIKSWWRSFRFSKGEYVQRDSEFEAQNPEDQHLQSLVDTLGAEEFFSVPMCYRGASIGRLFIISPQQRFGTSEAVFLLQAIDQVMPSLDNILLLDRRASDAAEEERQRIARDLHDSIIQPYIGLRIGLAGLSEELQKDKQEIKEVVKQLTQMTDVGIGELRNYVADLKKPGRANSDLNSSIQRFVTKFSAATTIQVDVEIEETLKINDRLAAEVFQMIAEGLSNIRRHTSAPRACIRVQQRQGQLELLISNECSSPGETFIPRSISERARSLGGSAQVVQDGQLTIVQVQIPL